MPFPTTLDSTTTIPVETASTPLSTNHVANHTAMQTAIIAMQTLMGVTASVVSGTFNYILGEITGVDKAVGKTATQTLTNKTLTAPSITGATITTSTVNGVTITTGGSVSNFLAASGSYVAGGVADASTTVKGIVEAATSAEVTAGTATGGTGAILVVTPDSLAASTPVFNGSGLTNVGVKLNITTTTVDVGVSSTAENTLLSYSLAGGILSTNNAVKVSCYFYVFNAGGVSTTTLRFKLGATTLFSPTFALSAGLSNYSYVIDYYIFANGATNAQNQSILMTGSSTTQLLQTTSTEDTTTAKSIVITAQSSTSDANYHATLRNVVITEILP